MKPGLRRLLRQTVTREPLASLDEYATPTYGSAVSIKARVVYKPTLLRTSVSSSSAQDGVREIVASAVVTTDVVGWKTTDRITMPDGTQPVILDVKSWPDESGRIAVEKVFV